MEGKRTGLRSCLEAAVKVFRGPEIPITLLFFAYGLFNPAQNYFIYNRICLYHFDSATLCEHIDTAEALQKEETIVQESFATFSSALQISSYTPVIFVSLIYGSWCDRATHRVPLAAAHIGLVIVTICLLLFSFLPHKAANPVDLGWIYVFLGLAGHLSCANMAAFSYASRTSTIQTRTLRLAVIEACLTFGDALGYIVNAFVFNGGKEYYYAFVIQIAINLYAVVYIIFLVPELHTFAEVKDRVMKEANGSWMKYLFSPRENLTSAFQVIFGKHQHRTANERRWLIMMVATYTTVVVTIGSKTLMQVLYAYFTLQPISMQPIEYAIFQATSMIMHALTLLLIVPLLRSHLIPYVLPFSDAALGVTSAASRIISLVVLGLGGLYPEVAPWVYCILSMLSVIGFLSIRSGMSKITKQFEHGRVFAVNALFDSLVGMIVGIGFNALYEVTVANLPSSEILAAVIHGYPLLFDAGLCIIPLLLLIWLGMQPIHNWSFHASTTDNPSALIIKVASNELPSELP